VNPRNVQSPDKTGKTFNTYSRESAWKWKERLHMRIREKRAGSVSMAGRFAK